MSRGTHTKAAAWVRRLDETRGSGIDAGCKGVLQCLWDHVDFDVERPATPRECWPSAETIAEQIGSTVAAVRDRLGKLTRAGWIRFEGRGWALAWVAPFAVDATPVAGDATPVSPGCDSSSSDSSRSEVRLQSQPGETLVDAGCDSSRTNQLMNNSGPTQDQEKEERRALHSTPAQGPELQPRQAPASPERRDLAAEREATKRENARKVAQAAATMREQFPDRSLPNPGKCPLELWAVVESHPASRTYAVDVHGNWAAKLGQLAAERSLTTDELAGLLDFWESERAKYATARDRDAALDSGAFPPMADLWFYKANAWVKWAIAVVRTPAGEAPPKRPSATTKPTQHNPALPNSTPYFAALRASGRDFAEGEGPEVDDIPF